MPFKLAPFSDVGLSESLLRVLLAEHETVVKPALRRLWRYYRNPARPARDGGANRPTLAQEDGLPPRLRGPRSSGADDRAPTREIVIENDIAWRVHALVDFMFGKAPTITSLAEDDDKRRDIERLLDAAFESSGGIAMLQDMALLGAVFGHVDLLLRVDDFFAGAQAARGSDAAEGAPDRALALAPRLRIELIEPTRSLPLLSPGDYRALDAYVIRFSRQSAALEPRGALTGALSRRRSAAADRRAHIDVLEVFSARHRQRYENERLMEEAPNPLGVVPVVHIQNASQPFHYAGVSEVEPLVPMQDELNTRLSDRANRVTLQSFKMYLAKGLEGFGEGGVAVGPGQIWSTDNPDASIESFGADAEAPSEESHIEDLREAMDKVSAVTPLAAGVLRAKLGALSSENALRVTLIGLLAKVARRRVTYGRGLARMSAMILSAFDAAGVFRTDPDERRVRVDWPDPLPQRESDAVDAARARLEIGVPRERVLAELGYAPSDPGVT